ncbi:enkurin-like [Boleophthalmus pectinirostris]|uniref:enkurin-like n=1 Tax=Boleophthalmus pectinirostris TaxID=150288 RepID=UPI00242E654A|nr:enkurin-like [Boleophthalmus pectinirostris]
MSTHVYRPQERVYDLLSKEEVKSERPPRYVSKFRPAVIQEEKLPKRPMRTMGPAKVEAPSPENFLKKHSKEPKLPDKVKEGRINPLRKPPVPTHTEIPPMGIQTKRDFIKTCTFVTTKPKPISVDTHKGHREELENSGRVPKYIKKTDFGKVPAYLQHRNTEKQKAQELYDNYVKEQREKQAMKQLSEEERRDILEGLKKNWDRIHHEYQGLSVVIDTWSKRAHKERLEADMKHLEKKIEMFERFKVIYISEN